MAGTSPAKRKKSAVDSLGENYPMEQFASLVPDGSTYCVLIKPDGKQAFFANIEEARAAARASGGTIVVRPTRAGLRAIGAAIGVGSEPLGNTNVTVTPVGNVCAVTISNAHMSLTLFTSPEGQINSAIAAVALRAGDRVVPSVGVAMREEHEGKPAPQHHVPMKALTRAINRALEDLTGAINVAAERVEKQPAPSVVLLNLARSRGLTPAQASAMLKSALGVTITEVTYEQLEAAISILESAEPGGSGADSGN